MAKNDTPVCEFCGSCFTRIRHNQIFCSNDGKCRRLASHYRKHPDPFKMQADIERMKNHPDRTVTMIDLQNQIADLNRKVDLLTSMLLQSHSPTPLHPPVKINGHVTSRAV